MNSNHMMDSDDKADVLKTGKGSVIKDILTSAHMAVSVYTKIPMPYIDMTGSSPRFLFCFFPLVGLIMGVIVWLWNCLYALTGADMRLLWAAVTAALPIFITGGIHMDGYMDCMDAYSSYRDRDKRLEILKDSHVGAFAVLWTVIYMLIYTAVIYHMPDERIILLGVVYTTERILLGFCLMGSSMARQKGMLASVMQDTARGANTVILLAELMICAAYVVYYASLFKQGAGYDAGPDVLWIVTLYAAMASVGAIGVYKAHKTLGGMTGDTCGCVIQMMEIAGIVVLTL